MKQLQPYSTFIGNPYFTLYESTNPSNMHSVTESLSGTLDITKDLQLMVRSGLQLSYDEREQHRPVSDVVFGKGYFKKQNVFDYEVNSDVLLSYKHNLGNSFDLATSLGGNLMRQHYNLMEASVTGLTTPGVFNLANGASSPYVVSTMRNKRLNSAYGTASLSWDGKVYLEATGRNDWSSTLPKKNCSFFYPSLGASILLDKLFSLPAQVSLLKLRGSWAQVGNDTDQSSSRKKPPWFALRYFTRLLMISYDSFSRLSLFRRSISPNFARPSTTQRRIFSSSARACCSCLLFTRYSRSCRIERPSSLS